MAYGVPIAEVARQVDSAVRYGIRHALEREVDRLTIHVDGLRYQPTALPAPPVVELDGGARRRPGRERHGRRLMDRG